MDISSSIANMFIYYVSGLSLIYRVGGCINEVDGLCPSAVQICYLNFGKWVLECASLQS